MTRSYELMLIVRPEVEASEKKAGDIVKKLVEKIGGKLTSVAVWGKKQLAYPISKATEGVYLLATVEGDGLKSADMQKEARLGSDVLRFLLIAK